MDRAPGNDPVPRLVESGSAAWVIDTTRAALVEANASGRALWALDARVAGPVGLDRAMPALARLAAKQGAGPEARWRERLVFWIGARVKALDCRCTTLGGGRVLVEPDTGCPVPVPEPKPGGPRRVVETSADGRALEAATTPEITFPTPSVPEPKSSRAEATVEADDAATGSLSPREAETLKEIGRRIRAGRAEPSAPVPEPRADGASALAATARSEPPGPHARAAHELRSPLGAIRTMAEMIERELLGPIGDKRYRGYAGDIVASADHALSLIDSMSSAAGLATADLIDPLLVAVPEIVDVGAAVRGCASAFAPSLESAGQRLHLALAERLPPAIVDLRHLRQMALNLMANAARHAGSGSVLIISTARYASGPLVVSFRDTGRGIAASEAAAGGGIGLGLVGELAAANGLRVEVAAVTGGPGTIARIIIPAGRLVGS